MFSYHTVVYSHNITLHDEIDLIHIVIQEIILPE